MGATTDGRRDAPAATKVGGRRRRRWRRILSILFALVLVVASCSGGDDDAATDGTSASSEGDGSGDTDTGAEEAADDDGGEAPAEESGGGVRAPAGEVAADEGAVAESEESAGESIGTGGGGVGALQPVDIGRDIVFTAQIDMAVDDVVVAGRQALSVIESLGGLLFGQETSVADTPRTVLVFKVEPSQFQAAVARLGEVGILTEQVITADDVTERIVDLESRIVTAEASVERLRTFLEGATALNQVASLERELLTRETDLELLRGRLRTLQGQVDLATITVVLRQARPEPGLAIEIRYGEGSGPAGSGCTGDEEATVGEGDAVTVCVEVRNDGDTVLSELDLVHRDLDLDIDDFTVLSGDPEALLAPGEAVVLAASFEAGPSVFGSARASAVPVDANGVDLGLGLVEADGRGRLDVEQELTLPGVGEAFSTGWTALVVAGSLVVLGLAVAVPFLWIPVVGWFVWRWRTRRGSARSPEPAGDAG